ncbi:MAG: response regulator transcription factor [Myxococcota bacterium]
MGTTHVIMVEDDAELAGLVGEYLGQHAFEVDVASDGARGVQMILECSPDLVILDLMLPQMDGLAVCRQVRREYYGPIMMLTASQSVADHVAGLEIGADDFVTKPLEPRVLLARIRSLMRRFAAPSAPTGPEHELCVGPLVFDLVTRMTYFDGNEVPLTGMEFNVLKMLADHAGSVVTRDDLYEQICDVPYDGLDRGMDVHVSRIRRKLSALGMERSRLKAVRGSGYLLAYQ